MDVSLIVRREVQIAAPPATVFAFLTDPDKILRWMGTEATAEPHPGGLYLLKVSGKDRARALHGGRAGASPRLQLRLGGRAKMPPESGLVEIDLIDRRAGHCCA